MSQPINPELKLFVVARLRTVPSNRVPQVTVNALPYADEHVVALWAGSGHVITGQGAKVASADDLSVPEDDRVSEAELGFAKMDVGPEVPPTWLVDKLTSALVSRRVDAGDGTKVEGLRARLLLEDQGAEDGPLLAIESWLIGDWEPSGKGVVRDCMLESPLDVVEVVLAWLVDEMLTKISDVARGLDCPETTGFAEVVDSKVASPDAAIESPEETDIAVAASSEEVRLEL